MSRRFLLYYDYYGRQIQSYVQHYLDITVNPANYDAITTSYDFTSEVTSTTRHHYNYLTGFAAGPVLTITNNYLYDHMGRKLQPSERFC